PDELEREPDCPCLEGRAPRRAAECISEQLFLDMHVPVLERGVHRVTAASEVDEVEELEMVVELVGRDVESLGQLVGGNRRGRVLATAGQEVGEQRLQDTEALWGHRAGRSLECLPLRLRRGRA